MTLFEKVKKAKINKCNEVAEIAKKIFAKCEPLILEAANDINVSEKKIDISEFGIDNTNELRRQLQKNGFEKFTLYLSGETLTMLLPSRRRSMKETLDQTIKPTCLYDQVQQIRIDLRSCSDNVVKKIVAKAENELMKAIEECDDRVIIDISKYNLTISGQLTANLKLAGLDGFNFHLHGPNNEISGPAAQLYIYLPTDRIKKNKNS